MKNKYVNLVVFLPETHVKDVVENRLKKLLDPEVNKHYGSDLPARVIFIGSDGSKSEAISFMREHYGFQGHSPYPDGDKRWILGEIRVDDQVIPVYETPSSEISRGIEHLEKKFSVDAIGAVIAGNRNFIEYVFRKNPSLKDSNVYPVYSDEKLGGFINILLLGAGTSSDEKSPMHHRFFALMRALRQEGYSDYPLRLILSGTPNEVEAMISFLEKVGNENSGYGFLRQCGVDSYDREYVGILTVIFKGDHVKGDYEVRVPVYSAMAHTGNGNLKSILPFLLDADDTVAAASHWFKQRIQFMVRRLNRIDRETWPEGLTLVQSNEKEALYDTWGIAYRVIRVPGVLPLLDWGMSQWRKLTKKGQKQSEKRSRVETHPGLFLII